MVPPSSPRLLGLTGSTACLTLKSLTKLDLCKDAQMAIDNDSELDDGLSLCRTRRDGRIPEDTKALPIPSGLEHQLVADLTDIAGADPRQSLGPSQHPR